MVFDYSYPKFLSHKPPLKHSIFRFDTACTMMFVRNDWANADAEIELRVKSGWLSKEEGHRLRTLLKMGETPERTVTKEFLVVKREWSIFRFSAYKTAKLKGVDV